VAGQEPLWTWASPHRIEWVSPVTLGDARVLLIADETGTLTVLQSDGAPVPGSPLALRPGIQPVESAGDRAAGTLYCFDRGTVYAVELSCPPAVPGNVTAALSWQTGERRPVPPQQRGDPEFVPRLVAAAATSLGVVVVRDDGRVALLDRRTGTPHEWCAFRAARTARVHVAEPHVAIVAAEGGATRAAIFPSPIGSEPLSGSAGVSPAILGGAGVSPAIVSAGSGSERADSPSPPHGERRAGSEPRFLTVGDAWPIWSALTPAGLLAAWPDRVIYVRTRSEPRCVATCPENALHTTGLAPVRLADGVAPARADLLLACCGEIRSIALGSGELRWSLTWPTAVGAGHVSLAAAGGRFVAYNSSAYLLGDAATGAILAEGQFAAGERLLNVSLADDSLCLMTATRDSRAALQRTPLPLSPRPPATQPAARLELPDPGAVRDVIWLGRLAVLVEPRRLRAFELEADN